MVVLGVVFLASVPAVAKPLLLPVLKPPPGPPKPPPGAPKPPPGQLEMRRIRNEPAVSRKLEKIPPKNPTTKLKF